MIDWLTLHLHDRHLSEDFRAELRSWGHRVQCYDAATGEVQWDASSWESVRSDSHRLAARYCSDGLWIQGSPARVIGDGLNVFGSMDIQVCAQAMIDFAGIAMGFRFPSCQNWDCTRVDVAQNYLLSSLADVRLFLSYLRGVEGGRYRVSQTAGDTVYWSSRSRLRSGKAYAKGPHLRYLLKRFPDAVEVALSAGQLSLLDRLVRLELRLGSQFFRERCLKEWFDLSPVDLSVMYESFFRRMIGGDSSDGGSEMSPKQKIFSVPGYTVAQLQAAYATWLCVREEGWQSVRESVPRRTFYRHMKIFRQAGLSDADISHGKVIPFRVSVRTLRPVSSWDDLRRLAS